MKFKELTEDELIQKIIALKEGLNCSPMWRTVFNSIHPKVKKSMPLKDKLKPHEKLAGPYTEMHLQMRGNSELMIKAQQKLRANGFYGEYYDNPEASLKMHLGLNNIGELDESVVLKLVKFLADEAESPDNQTSFHFKIIRPDQHLSERFKNTDQITIYFDKYSSIGDFMRLARRVDEFLKSQGLPENAIKLGPKDSFGFNSFATARFDTNKLLSEYSIHTFFDLELKKFFESHTEEELKDVPLCLLQAVFNKIITSEEYKTLNSTPERGLSAEDSVKVQAEFNKAIANPTQYFAETAQLDKEQQVKQDKARAAVAELVKRLNALTPNFDDKTSLQEINSYHLAMKSQLDSIISEADKNRTLAGVDQNLSEVIRFIEEGKLQEIDGLAERQKRKLGLDKTKEMIRLEEALDKIEKKAKELVNRGELVRANVAQKLHDDLKDNYEQFRENKLTFEAFKTNCKTAIDDSRPQLEQHSGWKEVFVNVLTAISTLGISLIYQAYQSKGKHVFFKVNTDSVNKVDELKRSMDDLGPKPE